MDLAPAALARAYAQKRASPPEVVAETYRRIRARGTDHVWTALVPEENAAARARALAGRDPRALPLYGLPFGVKDNIHVAGMPTTAACAALDQPAPATATCVRRLLEAGAILVGKQNMDQFATGLVGIRSPKGYCRNSFDERYIPGGSSSGSGVAVAAGLVSFSLGSDTGGSGRVPAALNNIVGLKPTPGAASIAGMLYCNRSFDCLPVFAPACEDAWRVFRVVRGFDPFDPFSRADLPQDEPGEAPAAFRFAAPAGSDLDFFGDRHAEAQFHEALRALRAIGGTQAALDYAPFREASDAVFGGACLAERLIDYGPVLESRPETIHPAVRTILEGARGYSAADAFREIHRLRSLRQRAHLALREVDVLVVPTAATLPTCAEVEADPIRLNARMGRYTYFVNPLDLCALAVPAGLRADGLPFGLCLVGLPGADARLLALGRAIERAFATPPGAPGRPRHLA